MKQKRAEEFRSLRRVLSIILFTVCACNSPYTSKKPGYFKIDLPEKEYQNFQAPNFPYSFEYPVYARIVRDSSYFDGNEQNPYWINIDFPAFNGKIFISYKTVGGTSVYKVKTEGTYKDSVGKNTLENMINDSYNLTYKNSVKAYSIEDSFMRTPHDISGIFFKVGGNVATASQFFLTDSTHHFLRGALYFDATPNEDSLQPVNDFLKEDIKHLINSLQWANHSSMTSNLSKTK